MVLIVVVCFVGLVFILSVRSEFLVGSVFFFKGVGNFMNFFYLIFEVFFIGSVYIFYNILFILLFEVFFELDLWLFVICFCGILVVCKFVIFCNNDNFVVNSML